MYEYVSAFMPVDKSTGIPFFSFSTHQSGMEEVMGLVGLRPCHI